MSRSARPFLAQPPHAAALLRPAFVASALLAAVCCSARSEHRQPPAASCSFCAADAAGAARTFDLSALPSSTFVLGPNGSSSPGSALAPVQYSIAAPCGTALPSAAHAGGPVCHPRGPAFPAVQAVETTRGMGLCEGLGSLTNASVALVEGGFDVALRGGSTSGRCPGGRTIVYHMRCDMAVRAADSRPDLTLGEAPNCTFHVTWRTASACTAAAVKAGCAPPPPAPPPAVCTGCLPPWRPTWDMRRSTVLMTCNDTGMHSVAEAVKFGTVVYDWCVLLESTCPIVLEVAAAVCTR